MNPWSPGNVCRSYEWSSAHIEVGTGGCQAIFGVEYAQNLSDLDPSSSYNFSFGFPWIVELAPDGALLRLASPYSPINYSANVTSGPGEINISVVQNLNVTSAAGNWTPEDTWAGNGTQWDIGNTTIGTCAVDFVFHLSNLTAVAAANSTMNASSDVKFDVDVSGWPWAATGDALGIGLDALGAGGSYFTFNQSDRTLAESWNGTDRPFVSLEFGGSANVTTGSTSTGHANVSEVVGLFYAASPDRRSVALLTFGGVPGNYTALRYDPWILFHPSPSAPSGSPSSSWVAGWPDWAFGAVLLAVIVGVVGLPAALILNGRRLRREGEELVGGMRRAISGDVDKPDGPR